MTGRRVPAGGEPAGNRPDPAAVSWSAPGRLNLIGEHTDYNDGYVLPLALPYGTTATVRLRTDGLLRLHSAQRPAQTVQLPLAELRPGRAEGWAAYLAGPVWALAEAGHLAGLPGLEVAVDGRVPEGAGLSSSHALACAVAAAVNDLLGLGIDRTGLALLVQRSENGFVGVPTGIMDQMAALLCTAGAALFLDTRTLVAEQVPLHLAEHGLALLGIDTRSPHRLVSGEYAARRRSCEQAAARLGVRALRDVAPADLDRALPDLADDEQRRRVRHVVTENARVLRTVALLRAGRYRDVGPLLTASHASLRDDYEVTVPQLDVAVAAALAAGAVGARMTGGGFGGCVLALVDTGTEAAVRAAVARAYAERDFAAPGFFAGTPSPGAHRVEG